MAGLGGGNSVAAVSTAQADHFAVSSRPAVAGDVLPVRSAQTSTSRVDRRPLLAPSGRCLRTGSCVCARAVLTGLMGLVGVPTRGAEADGVQATLRSAPSAVDA